MKYVERKPRKPRQVFVFLKVAVWEVGGVCLLVILVGSHSQTSKRGYRS